LKLFITLLALLNGGFMLLDGIFVIVNGKFIGPEKPGPWSEIFYSLGINPFALGPLFVVYGLLWLTFVGSVWTSRPWMKNFGIGICMLTLWYLPVGTAISILIVVMLSRTK
jgi:hypothetical protein